MSAQCSVLLPHYSGRKNDNKLELVTLGENIFRLDDGTDTIPLLPCSKNRLSLTCNGSMCTHKHKHAHTRTHTAAWCDLQIVNAPLESCLLVSAVSWLNPAKALLPALSPIDIVTPTSVHLLVTAWTTAQPPICFCAWSVCVCTRFFVCASQSSGVESSHCAQ